MVHSTPTPTRPEDRLRVGKFLEDQRLAAGLTARQVAERTGYTTSYIASVEAGRMMGSRKAVRFMLDVIGVDTSTAAVNAILEPCVAKGQTTDLVKRKMAHHYGARGMGHPAEPGPYPEPEPESPAQIPLRVDTPERLYNLVDRIMNLVDVHDVIRWLTNNNEALTDPERLAIVAAVLGS